MATQRQKKLAKAIVENLDKDKPKNAGEILESIGYSKNTAIGISKEIIEGKGVIEELEKLGFSETKAKEVVGGILANENEESNTRLKAADMVFKVNATYAPERSEVKQTNIQANFFFANPKIMEATRIYEEALKQAIINETEKPTETL
jgi:hypothetical protein